MQNLLSQVAIVNKKNEQLLEATGQKYNIFSILGLTSNETRLHSAFLANLLDPNGSHGLKSKPLDAFLKIIGATHLDSTTATVEIEKYIGLVTDKEGGRIDILISDKNRNSIIIENKIYAADQRNQLLRYFNYAKSSFKTFQILYLTLEGTAPQEYSTGKEKIDYFSLSFKENIQKWLEECLMFAAKHPLLRETISQYSNLINQLTNNDMNTQAKEEILEVLTYSKSNIEAAFKIATYYNDIKTNIVIRYLVPFLSQYALDNGLVFESDFALNQKYKGFSFYHADWKFSRLRIHFEWSNCTAMIYGINATDLNNFPTESRNKLKQIGDGSSDHLPYYKFCSKYRNWDNSTFSDIFEGKAQVIIKQELDRILAISNSCKL